MTISEKDLLHSITVARKELIITNLTAENIVLKMENSEIEDEYKALTIRITKLHESIKNTKEDRDYWYNKAQEFRDEVLKLKGPHWVVD